MKFLYCRPFGTEIEINAFDGVYVASKDRQPSGIHHVANLVSEILEEYVEIRGYGHTHWFKPHGYWVVKPDNSCGIEVCSPVSQGWYGLQKICRVIEVFQNHSLISADTQCSLHVHIDVNDLFEEEIANILRWWICCEPVFFDSVPSNRKNNRYCQFIGLWDWVDETIGRNTTKLIETLGVNKYGSINSYHLWAGGRNTLEFRIGENTICKNAYFFKNWVRLLIHFMEIARQKAPSSLYWMDVKDVFDFLGFLNKELSPGMIQIRDWFLARILVNSTGDRIITRNQALELSEFFSDFNIKKSLYPSDYKDAVYNKIFSF